GQDHIHGGGKILTGRIRGSLRPTDPKDVNKNDCRQLMDNQVDFRRTYRRMRENLPYLAAPPRKDLAQDISLFLAKVLGVSDKYANQWQISIDEGHLRFSTF